MNPDQAILSVDPTLDLLTDLPIFSSGYKIGASLLEPLVAFAMEPGYSPYWFVTPQVNNLPLAPNQVFEDNISVPDGSYLVALTYASNRDAGFKFNIYDSGSRKWLFNRDVFAKAMAGGAAIAAGIGAQPHILEEPYPILGPLNVILTNLDNGGGTGRTTDMQLLLWVASPSEDTGDLYPGIDPALPHIPSLRGQ